MSSAGAESNLAMRNGERIVTGTELHHCELFVEDAPSLAYYFVNAYGFAIRGVSGPETGMTDAMSVLLVHGDIHLVLTSALDPGHRAADYVRRHGYGVATIAVLCDDAGAAYEAVLTRGGGSVLPPVRYESEGGAFTIAEVHGVGDLVHRFVQVTGRPQGFLPGFASRDAGAGRGVLRTLDHFALCVPAGELDSAVHLYRETFGYRQIFEEYVSFGDQAMDSRVVQSPGKGVTLVIAQPDPQRPATQVQNFVRLHDGPGVQHLAFGTDDVVRAAREVRAGGVELLPTPAAYYDILRDRVGDIESDMSVLRELDILVDRDHWGLLLQVFTRSPHVRRTLFFELIERRSARTFGSANIQALYEAVQRDQERLGLSTVTEADREPVTPAR